MPRASFLEGYVFQGQRPLQDFFLRGKIVRLSVFILMGFNDQSAYPIRLVDGVIFPEDAHGLQF
jgi:hypothetical protein